MGSGTLGTTPRRQLLNHLAHSSALRSFALFFFVTQAGSTLSGLAVVASRPYFCFPAAAITFAPRGPDARA
eukprot:6478492-Amphidinium_carterae.1